MRGRGGWVSGGGCDCGLLCLFGHSGPDHGHGERGVTDSESFLCLDALTAVRLACIKHVIKGVVFEVMHGVDEKDDRVSGVTCPTGGLRESESVRGLVQLCGKGGGEVGLDVLVARRDTASLHLLGGGDGEATDFFHLALGIVGAGLSANEGVNVHVLTFKKLFDMTIVKGLVLGCEGVRALQDRLLELRRA